MFLSLIDKDNFTLLDIGCGRGLVARIIRDIYPQTTVYGIDISPEQIDKARLSIPDGIFQVANEINLPFGNESIDYATCRMSIHHYPDMISHLKEVLRVLKPGGIYIIIDAIPSKGLQDQYLNDVFLSAEASGNGDGHLKFYTIDEYSCLFDAVGFTIGCQYSLPHFVTWTKSDDYRINIYKHILQTPEEFRNSIHFVDEEELYGYGLPMFMLSAIKPR